MDLWQALNCALTVCCAVARFHETPGTSRGRATTTDKPLSAAGRRLASSLRGATPSSADAAVSSSSTAGVWHGSTNVAMSFLSHLYRKTLGRICNGFVLRSLTHSLKLLCQGSLHTMCLQLYLLHCCLSHNSASYIQLSKYCCLNNKLNPGTLAVMQGHRLTLFGACSCVPAIPSSVTGHPVHLCPLLGPLDVPQRQLCRLL